MTRTRVRPLGIARLLVVAAVGAGLVVAMGRGVQGAPERAPAGGERRTYVVQPGDTLWAIAQRLEPGRDPRPLVDAIAAANGVAPGNLVPGQTLVLPR